jgi:malate synthase
LDPALAGFVAGQEKMMNALQSGHAIVGTRAIPDRSILTPEALDFVSELVSSFRERIADLLAQRRAQQRRAEAGERPSPLESTAWIREADWHCGPVAPDLLHRPRTITGPADRESIRRAIAAGCGVFVAQLDAATLLVSQGSLREMVRGELPTSGEATIAGVRWSLPTIVVRPRSLDASDPYLFVNRRPAPAVLVDAGLFLFHNAHALTAAGAGPYFYLSDVQSYQEARLWNDVFLFAEARLGLAIGTIKATVRIATSVAAVQMNEILFALRRHSAGLHGLLLDSSRAALVETCRRRGVPARVL